MLQNGKYAIKIVAEREGSTHLATYTVDDGVTTQE
jgi:hypothetical protein